VPNKTSIEGKWLRDDALFVIPTNFHEQFCKWDTIFRNSSVALLKKAFDKAVVNFTNILRVPFPVVVPITVKRHCWLDCLFCAFRESACVKAACRMLMKLTPEVRCHCFSIICNGIFDLIFGVKTSDTLCPYLLLISVTHSHWLWITFLLKILFYFFAIYAQNPEFSIIHQSELKYTNIM